MRAEAAPFVPPRPAALADSTSPSGKRRSQPAPAPHEQPREAAPAPCAEDGAGWTLVVKRDKRKTRSPSPRSSAADSRAPRGGAAGAIVPAGEAKASPAKKGKAAHAAAAAPRRPLREHGGSLGAPLQLDRCVPLLLEPHN